jgi:hypothetical protein
MEGDGGGVRARGDDELAFLKMGEGALDGAAGEAGGIGDRLMGGAHRPAGLLGGAPEEVQVDDEGGGATIVADEVGEEAVEEVGVEGNLYHHLL